MTTFPAKPRQAIVLPTRGRAAVVGGVARRSIELQVLPGAAVASAAADDAAASAAAAAVSESNAAASESAAAVSETNAANSALAAQAAADSVRWESQGAYSGATAYLKNDVVLDQGSSWVALQDTTGNAPPTLPTTSNAYWQLVAKQGDGGSGDVTAASNIGDGALVVGDGGGKGVKAHSSGAPGTAAFKNTGTSGDAVPLLNAENTFGAPVNVSEGLGGSFRLATTAFGGTIGANAPTSCSVTFDPQPGDGTSNAVFGMLRLSNTTATGSSVIIYAADGTSAIRHRIYAKGGYVCGNPTGGDKGVGSINAQAVYDDNVLLSCYVFDAALDGSVSLEKWDDKVPDRLIPAAYTEVHVDTGEKCPLGKPILRREEQVVRPEKIVARQHDGARKFATRLGGQYDPLDIDKYTAHWREKRHLSSMPNEEKFDPEKGMASGEWIQRLIETVEIQAVHIAALNDRVKALEAKAQPKRL